MPREWQLGGYINGGFISVNWYLFLSPLLNVCHMVDHSKKTNPKDYDKKENTACLVDLRSA